VKDFCRGDDLVQIDPTCTITHMAWEVAWSYTITSYSSVYLSKQDTGFLGFFLRIPLPLNLGRDYKTWY
jgi:hypothetical protein